MHHRIAAQQTDQFGAGAFDISQRIEQIKHAATLGQQWFARRMVRADRVEHRGVLRQRHVVQFRVAARQIQTVRLRQLRVADRREETQLGAHRPQQIEAGAVGEGERLIMGDSDSHTLQ